MVAACGGFLKAWASTGFFIVRDLQCTFKYPMKYILVTGGVISGIGKGIIASSIGTILKSCGLRVTAIKIDPYINIDAGTFSPYEHGEVFVLNDGGEVDLDLGNYERFLDINLYKDNNITTGKIYQHVINKERHGDYLGKTVQVCIAVVPHITDAVQEWVMNQAKVPVDSDKKEPQICVIELGGTIGDIEGMPFVEAFRQFQFKAKRENFCNIHVSLVPQLKRCSPKIALKHTTLCRLSPPKLTSIVFCSFKKAGSFHPFDSQVKETP
uniref:CTP synthase 2 n=1 Tax=Sphaerodactylus townsendi TaxID=933632 RepID=A0ACB8FIJ1_9SAUR